MTDDLRRKLKNHVNVELNFLTPKIIQAIQENPELFGQLFAKKITELANDCFQNEDDQDIISSIYLKETHVPFNINHVKPS